MYGEYTAGSEIDIAVEETDLRITTERFVKTSSQLQWRSKGNYNIVDNQWRNREQNRKQIIKNNNKQTIKTNKNK